MESSSLVSTNQNLDGCNLPTRFTLQNTCLPRREQLLTPQLRKISQQLTSNELQNAVAKGEYLTLKTLNSYNISDLFFAGLSRINFEGDTNLFINSSVSQKKDTSIIFF